MSGVVGAAPRPHARTLPGMHKETGLSSLPTEAQGASALHGLWLPFPTHLRSTCPQHHL